MEKSFVFDAVLVDGVYDREYLSEDFCNYFKSFISDGVFPNPSTNLQVIASSNMDIVLNKGKAFKNGRLYENTEPLTFTIEPADGVLNRIDTVILQVDNLKREFKAVIKKGTFAVNPIPQELLNNADYEELKVAEVYVKAGTIKITQADITDTRLDKNVCGLVSQMVQSVDTSTLYRQIQSDLEKFNTEEKARFLQWFDGIKTILDENTAGNLLNLINSKADLTYLNTKLTEQQTYTDTYRTYTLNHTKLGTAHTLSDLPTGQGIFQCQFIAQSDYNEGDVFVKPTRNLIEQLTPKTMEINGITFTINAEGSVAVKGTLTGTYAEATISIFKPNLYTHSIYTLSGGTGKAKVGLTYKGKIQVITASNEKTIFNPKETTDFNLINAVTVFVSDSIGTKIDETVYPMLNKGGTALPYEPYGYNLPLTAKPTGEEQSLPDKAFVKGDLVSITVDTVNKKLGFKIGGSGINQTLPPQIRSFAVTSGNAKNTLSWALPIDTTAYEGLLIIRKVGSAPTSIKDGTKFYINNTTKSYIDTGLTNDTKYYYRAFPYNSKKQYQTDITGAVVSATPKEGMPISNLPVGTLVKDINTKYYDEPIVWKIADKNHSTYPSNSVTLITNKIIKMGCADGKEPANVNGNRAKYGNNRYSYSNVRQWLNSQQTTNEWYMAQHQYDAPPDTNGTTANPYVNKNGFLYSFSQGFLSLLMTTSITIAKSNTDGGGVETIQDKIFLLSDKEVGNVFTSNVISYSGVNDTVLTLFNNVTDNERIAEVAQSVLDNDRNTSKRWFLRFPFEYGANIAHTYCCVSETGSTSSQSAEMGTTGFRPACNIKNNALVSVQPDTDGAYIIQF